MSRPRLHNDFPRELACTGNCGKAIKQVRAQYLKARDKLNLSDEEYKAQFRCRSCKKEGNPSQPVQPSDSKDERSPLKSKKEADPDISENNFREEKALSKAAKAREQWRVRVEAEFPTSPAHQISRMLCCWNQPLFYKNGHHCDGCWMYNGCRHHARRLQDEQEHERRLEQRETERATAEQKKAAVR